MWKLIVHFTATVAIAHGSAFAATITSISTRNSPSPLDLRLDGVIAPGDVERLMRLIGTSQPSPAETNSFRTHRIRLNSTGGDIDEALKLGRILRQYRFITEVILTHQKVEECLSACVFAFLAGVERRPWGTIGVHRSYRQHVSVLESESEVRDRLRETRKKITDYLDEVNAPMELLTIIDSTPPDQMRILSLYEKKSLGFLSTDAVFEELAIARYADERQISSAEYRRRKVQGEIQCKKHDPMNWDTGRLKPEFQGWGKADAQWEVVSACRQAIEWNVTVQELLRRRAMVELACLIIKDEKSRQDCATRVMRSGK